MSKTWCSASSFATVKVTDQNVEKTPITAQLWQMRNAAEQLTASKDTTLLPPKQADLPAKTVAESRHILRYNFRSNSHMRDLYVDPLGNVIIGKILEDIDALGGNVGLSHCDDEAGRKLSVVTASVDKIVQNKPLSIDSDLILVGQMVWAGKTSMVVLVELHPAEDVAGQDCHSFDPLHPSTTALLTSFFTFAARNLTTGKAEPVNKLILSTPTEQALFDQRAELVAEKKKQQLLEKQNDLDHKDAIIQLVEAGCSIKDMPALAHPSCVLMSYTALENSLVCHPQNVNTAGRVFGGFIMHRAYDLALATCYTFAGCYPVFLESDSIAFRRPVDVGDLLRLKSRVIFTSDDPIHPRVVVEVLCQVVRPERASSFVSNSFMFTFGFGHNVALRKVLPVTSEEAKTLVQGAKVIHGNIDAWLNAKY
eukprot:gene3490-3823_t